MLADQSSFELVKTSRTLLYKAGTAWNQLREILLFVALVESKARVSRSCCGIICINARSNTGLSVELYAFKIAKFCYGIHQHFRLCVRWETKENSLTAYRHLYSP